MHRLTEFSLRRPWLTLGILLAITVVLGVGVPKVKQAYGFRVMVGSHHPAIQALDSLIAEFAGGYPVRIAWECGPGKPCKTVFDRASLEMADALTQELALLPDVTNVLGPANATLLLPTEDGFSVRRFIENGELPPDSQQLAQHALNDTFWVDSLVSSDALVGVVVVQPSNNEPDTDLRITDSVQEALKPFRREGYSYHVLGDAPETVFAGRALAKSTSELIPVLVLVIGVILYLLSRSWQLTLIALATMGLALLWTRGVLGWFGWPQDGMLQVLAPLVVIIGVCDSVHFLDRYVDERRKRRLARVDEALVAAARDTGPACLITTLTSAVAFASFTASDLDTFVRFGVVLPVGIVSCLVLCFSLVPVAISLLPAGELRSSGESSTVWRPVMSAISQASSRRSTLLLVATCLLLVFFGYGWAAHLRADNDFMEALGESSRVVQAVRFVEESLGGSQTLELDIQLPAGTKIESPGALAILAAFSERLSGIRILGDPESVLDLIKRLNRLLHEDQPEFERLGESPAANAELLELIAFDDPKTLSGWLSLDRSRLRMSLSGTMDSRDERAAALAEVQRLVQTELPENWLIQPTGEVAIQHAWVRDVQATQLRSFPIAFGLVFILVSIFLRSWKLGLAAMVPTLLPVVVVLGAMGGWG